MYRKHQCHDGRSLMVLCHGAVTTGPPEKRAHTEAAQQSPVQTQDDFAVSLSSNRRASVRMCAAVHGRAA